MNLKKKIVALLMITTILSTTAFAQASCKLVDRFWRGNFRNSTWNCGKYSYHTISVWNGEMWIVTLDMGYSN